MKIAIVNPVRAGGCGGLVKHLFEVVPRMASFHGCGQVDIITPTGAVEELRRLANNFFEVSKYDYYRGFQEIRKIIRQNHYDVALCTTARHVGYLDCPLVMMVRNIEPIQRPNYAMSIAWRCRLWMIRHEHAVACKAADHVLAVSNNMRNEVCREFKIKPNKVAVVYHGYTAESESKQVRPGLSRLEDLFLFSAGSIVPYRGFEDIIRALDHLRMRLGWAPIAVLAGVGGAIARPYEKSLSLLAKKMGVEDRLVWAGQLCREEMNWCYNNAALFIQTSRAESFGNVALEAMGHGCISISCNQPTMLEIYKDAAIFYPTGDSLALCKKIEEILAMPVEEKKILKDRAKKRSSHFSWGNTASQTFQLLEKVITAH
ncbi:MAG: glycosyltransferase [Desulfatitalea sp.]|nr:glycosyltransferase [Desulfatitalea sp.]NNJ99966.1 glycosyltransferase [Desulfatitalea sp.]